MGIGVSMLLIAAGAVLVWAIHVSTHGAANLDTIGWILIVVGAVGAIAVGIGRASCRERV